MVHHQSVKRDLPSGTVTLLFTDIEGSTKLLEELGTKGYAQALAEHRRLVREAFSRRGGVEVDTQGDAFFVAFPTAPDAIEAAKEALDALARGPIRVRMGLHTGTPHVTDEGYVGRDVHKAARIAAAGHGGQVLMSTDTRALIDGPVTDLGEHRLKDFSDPVWIFQFGTERFPPLKTISNTNLPRPANLFVGRGREVSEVASLLGKGIRLLTLTGPGGSGKTRLAIEVAAECVPKFRNGVFWVGLAPIRDPAIVLETVSEATGANGNLADHIGEREMLLLLDNLEQVIGIAPDLASLVEVCPNLSLLITSRELLRVRGEVEYPVPPLARDEAIELFCTRSRLEPGETIAELCRRLDDLPLAVELAASRTSALSPAQILEHLSKRLDLLKGGRDATARQQTLRSTIEWSHELLSGPERSLFARLSVFDGGCTLGSAQDVCDADLDVIGSLVDKSLLRHTGERFWMLETIGQFASERLAASGEAGELQRRHAEHFLAMAEEAEPHLDGLAESTEWLDRLGHEHDNIRTAIDHLQSSGETQAALRLVGAVWVFWRDRSCFAEGRRRLESALSADESPTAARADVLVAAASMATLGGDAASGRAWAEEALLLSKMLGDEEGIAECELWLGWALFNEGDGTGARALFDISRQRFHEIANEHQAVLATALLAMACAELGERDRARTLNEDALRRARAMGYRQIEATTLDGLARIAMEDGRVRDSLATAAESLRIYHMLGDPHGVAIELRRCARALAPMGEGRTAALLLAAADVLHGEIGGTMPWVARMKEESIASIRAQLHEAALAAAWEEGRTLAIDQAVSLVLDRRPTQFAGPSEA